MTGYTDGMDAAASEALLCKLRSQHAEQGPIFEFQDNIGSGMSSIGDKSVVSRQHANGITEGNCILLSSVCLK
jgi:hypothetical protein